MNLTEPQYFAEAWAGGADAVHSAVAGAVDRLGGASPRLVLFFAEATGPAPEFADQAVAGARGARLAGMSATGVLTPKGLRRDGCSALALGGEGVAVGVGVAHEASRDLRAAGSVAAAEAIADLDLSAGHAVVLLFLDPRSGDESHAVAGAYAVVGGRIPLAGGGANGAAPSLYGDGAALADAVVAVAIECTASVEVATAHGCRPCGMPALVTRAEGRTVLELDGRPAESVYLELLGRPGAVLNDEEFERLAVLHPMAQPELRGNVRLRHVAGRAPGGGLACVTPIPANAAIWLAEQTEQTIVESAGHVVHEVTRSLSTPPRAALIFDCAARRAALGAHAVEEAGVLVSAFGPEIPVAGLYTRGEVARTRGSKGISITLSWLSASASALGEGNDGIQRRFLEASRRAEIVTLVNSAHTEAELAEAVIEELGEALEAEVAFILLADPDRADWVVLARTGLSAEQAATVSGNEQGAAAFDDLRARVYGGTDLLGMGARHLILSPWEAQNGREVLIGVARLYDERFAPSEVALLEAVTVSVGHALERTWLGAERDRHAARQTSLVRAAKAINASLVIDEVIRTLCQEISEALAADVVAVYFADESGELRAVAGSGIPEKALGHAQPAGAPSAAVIRTGVPTVLRSQPEDPALDVGLRGVDGIRCGLVVPARRHDDVDGALLVGFLADRTIGEADIELLVGFAELAGIAYRNADEHTAVQRAAMLDSLTGCLNHGAFHSRLREEVSRADRSRRCLTLISIDLDDFKSVNDRFGHPTGDALLRTLADALQDAVRSYDQVGRLGGDEFVLLLPASEEGPPSEFSTV